MLQKFQIVCGFMLALLAAGCGERRALPDRLEVQMTGSAHQWEIRHAGWDARFGTADDVVTQGHMQLPRGVPVCIHLCSEDFIYGVRVADLGLAGIAMPGLENSIEFVPEQLGQLPLRGDQLCGFSYPGLMVTVEVVAEEQFFKALCAAEDGS